MTIIPAIDIIDGKCVRLSKGDFNVKTIYQDDPLSIAKEFEIHGLRRLHLVDLEGAREGKVKNWKVLKEIAANTSLEIDFSGGLSDLDSVMKALETGAHYVALGSMAVKNEKLVEEWIGKLGTEKFIIGADIRNGKIAINGWGSNSEMTWNELLRIYTEKGIRQFFCTDINKDGLLQGPAIDLYKAIMVTFPGIKLIASGGVSSLEDLFQLKKIGCAAAIVGKAIYEKKVSLQELEKFDR